MFLATNSRNRTEVRLLQEHFELKHYVGEDITPHMGIHVDLLVASQGIAFLGTPGSTFTETITQDHLLTRGHANDIYTMCSIGTSSTAGSATPQASIHDCSV